MMLMRRGILDVQVRIIRYVDRRSCLEVPSMVNKPGGTAAVAVISASIDTVSKHLEIDN